ncbi:MULTISPECIES: alpha/beta fold hydrolase [unclassified Streptomyces]|uniref:alpha/beta fold hydrolase n=1 Tax=unclassified Streptomyces TaxID=2593676 RepID=UPI00381ACDDD
MRKVKSGDGTTIAYRRSGEGPPVIVVGGAFSTAASEAPLAELLAPSLSVITYDRRGRGASGDTGPYAVERETEDLAALLEEAGGSASLFGVGSGAALVLEAAAAGLPVTQLAVYEPPYATDPAELPHRAAYTERLTGLLARGRRDKAVELSLAAMGLAPVMTTALARSPRWRQLTALAHTLAYDNALLGRGLIPVERLSTVGTRAMVVDGGASPPPPRNAARAVAGALRRGRHRTLTGQTHEVAPHVLAPVLEEFFTA